MSDDRRTDPVQRLFGLVAEHLEAWLEGDELALEGLGEALQEAGVREDQLETMILTLRSLAGTPPGAGVATLDETPGQRSQRVLSPEERDSLSPEAWGFLLALRQRGSLDAGQFERVLDQLTAIGVRPVGVDLARDVAVRVALHTPGHDDTFDDGVGDGETPH